MKVFATHTPLFITALSITTAHSMDYSNSETQVKSNSTPTSLTQPYSHNKPADWSNSAWNNWQDQTESLNSEDSQEEDQLTNQQQQQNEIERLNKELQEKQAEIKKLTKKLKNKEKSNTSNYVSSNAVWENPDGYWTQWQMTNFFER